MIQPEPAQPPSAPAPSWPPPGGPPPSWPPTTGFPPPPPPYGPVPQPVYWVPSPVPERPETSAGHAAFALSWIALPLSLLPIFGIVGMAVGVGVVMLGLRALRLAKLGYVVDRGLAIAGIGLSGLGLFCGAVINIVFLLAMIN